MGKYTWKSGFLSLIYMQEKTELDRNIIGERINPDLKTRLGDEVKVSYFGLNLYQEFPLNPFWKFTIVPSFTTF